jgi:N-acetylglucosamine kinase-like BadF-type ATPase
VAPKGEAALSAAIAELDATGQAPSPVVIGIDAGGTYTRAAAATLDGHVVARTRRAAANPRTVGDDAGRAELVAAVDDLRAAVAGDLVHVVIGSAGLIDPAPGEACRAWAARLGAHAATVDSDARIAHAAAFGTGAGVMVVAGTGSQCLAFGRDGRRVRVGGWGPSFGDEGSAYWIARKAVATALHALDAGDRHPLLTALLEAAAVPEAATSAARHEALLDYLYGEAATPTRHAAFATQVARLADDGVEDAATLLDEAGRLLAGLARTAAERSGATTVARAGSVLDANDRVRSSFERSCREGALDVVDRSWDPVDGAVRLAVAAARDARSRRSPT